jgi:hypothetical protein
MLLDHLNKIPPFVCRLYARRKHGLESASVRDIAARSGLSRSYVAILCHRRTWKGVSVDAADRFAAACGVDFMTPWKVADHFRKAKQSFLFRAHPVQRRLFMKLLQLRSDKHAEAA